MQLKIISQEGGFLTFLGPLVRAGLTLMKNALILLVKCILKPLGLMETQAASATAACIEKKIFRSNKWRSGWYHKNS